MGVHHLLVLAGCFLYTSNAQAPSVSITVDFSQQQDLPLFKKYAVMNSGLVQSERYNDTILESLGMIKASAFVTDLYMGTTNQNASFGQAVSGQLASAGANGITYNYTELDRVITGLGSNGVTPYWAVTYAPFPFQPATITNNATQLAQCLGFDDPEHYQCRPVESSGSTAGFDDCWKCPTKDAQGGQYTEYGNMLAEMASHQAKLNVTVYKQIWNEPDLTSYFNYSTSQTTFFHGTAHDYNMMYEAGSTAMAKVDPDLVVGGPGLAYWLQTDPVQFPNDQRVSGTYFAQQVANSSLPIDFFSFHAIAACNDATCDDETNGGQATFDYRAEVARYVLTQPPAPVTFNTSYFNTTELHCTEYFGGTLPSQYYLPYTASTDLAVTLLSNFLKFLDQTDVTQVTWAQYMDIVCCNGTGLLDYYGNARPTWHSFRFWGDIPVERVQTNISNSSVVAVSGYSPRECHAGVLFWNNGSTDFTATVNISNIPFSNFTVDVYVLDANHYPQAGLALKPFVTYTGQNNTKGIYSFPPKNATDFVLLNAGIVYLNITAPSCQVANALPTGRILRTHHLFSKRPYQTYMYGEFDEMEWAAYVGMGNETQGTALAGATVMVDKATVFNFTMNFFKIPPPPSTPAMGVRIDFWDATTNTFPANSSVFFYQTGTKAGAQIPPLYGSEANVPLSNFYYVNLASFTFNPSDSNYPVPKGWNGKMSIIFMLQDGPLFSAVQCYITQQPAIAQAVPAAAG